MTDTPFHDFPLASNGREAAVPRAVIAAGNIMQGGRGGMDLPEPDITRVRNHLAKYYRKMGQAAPWERG
jgi:hypothetical protein